MSAYDKRQKIAALAQLAAQSGAGIGTGTPMGEWGSRMGQMSANFAQAAAEKERQEELENAEKGNGLGKIGSVVLGAIGGVAGGPAGAALGASVGSAAGQALGGGKVNPVSVAGSGVSGYLGGMGAKNAAVEAAPDPVGTGTILTDAGVEAIKSQATPTFGQSLFGQMQPLQQYPYAQTLQFDPRLFYTGVPGYASFDPTGQIQQQGYDPMEYLNAI